MDRSLQREQARLEQARQRRRAQEVEQDKAPAPLFGAPIKVYKKIHHTVLSLSIKTSRSWVT